VPEEGSGDAPFKLDPLATEVRTAAEQAALEGEQPWFAGEDVPGEDDVSISGGPAESDGIRAVRDVFADNVLPAGVRPLPPIKKNVGAFSGFWGAVPKGVASAALQTVSSAATVAA